MRDETDTPLPECDKPLMANCAEDHVYPWFCEHCDIVYDWQDLEYTDATTTSREG